MTDWTDLTPEEQTQYENYRRWAIAPLMTREQWIADHRLSQTDFPAWLKRHNIG